MMDIRKSLDKLFALHNFGIKLGLENTIGFLEHIGNPQRQLKTFHIAGSNGKGSTASFISSILQECGYKTGLYTSPHFVKFNERIQINGQQIDDKYIADFINKYEKYIDEHQLTFFEVTTVMAFKYFFENKTDYCVIETGLGGRLDATNVLLPLAVIITSISFEHTNILGSTLKEITSEKAAIIKPGIKVFAGKLIDEAENIIEEKCTKENSELFKLTDYINEHKDYVELYTDELELDDWTMPLRGRYQKYNAALAGLTVNKTLFIDDIKKIKAGIKNVVRNTNLQGRYEFYHEKPTIIFDSAHNPEGISNFLSEFGNESGYYDSCTLLFGAMKDKSIREMLSLLKPYFDNIFLSEIKYDRAAKAKEIQSICTELSIKAEIVKSNVEFVKEFLTNSKKDCLVVLGSMYLLGEIKGGLAGNNT
jgi:dihydrofolate synthase/folylpolyglutamate synthase